MCEKYSISMNLFYENGNPNETCFITLDNFTGYMYRIPRELIFNINMKEKLKGTGVYLLIDSSGEKPEIYIGESDDIYDRLNKHDNDITKSWFSEVIVILALDNYLNKAKNKYIENKLFLKARSSKRSIMNQTIPQKPKLSLRDKKTLSEFIDKITLMISALGYKFFIETDKEFVDNEKEYFYYNKDTEKEAKAYRNNEEFILCKDSYISPENKSKYEWHKKNRIIHEDKIDEDDRLSEDIIFTSASAALSFVAGNNMNGNDHWKTANGITLKERKESENRLKT